MTRSETPSPLPFRLPAGGLIDRSTEIRFSFDGRSYAGHPGDTLASALLANGVRLVGRSFKYHRPRGLLSAGPEEPNGLVELRAGARREPNTRATVAELYDGLEATSQNRWPSLRFDLMSLNQLAAPILSAGFYYKTFMWPAALWEKLYEPMIRRAAGLGRAAEAPDPDRYEKATAHCDVLVVGGGPAGLAAALAAARTGARVILADEDFRLGGRLLAEAQTIDGRPALEWAALAEAELEAAPEVRIFRRTTVFGAYDHGAYGAVERVNDHVATPPAYEPRQRLWRFVAERCVLAAGAIERPLVFPGNDRPGVMLAGAVRTYAHRYGVAAGREAVVFSTGDDALRTARELAAGGVTVAAWVDARREPPDALREAVQELGAPFYPDGAITAVHGRTSIQAVDIRTPLFQTTLECDLVAMSGGWSPTLHLTSHLGGRPVWDEALGAYRPGAPPPGMSVAGAAAGGMTLRECLATGGRLGLEAARAAGFEGTDAPPPVAWPESAAAATLWRGPTGKGKAFVDFQNDVTDADLELAEREGYRSVEHAKRYTTLGMATDQGKTSGVNAVGILAGLRGQGMAETGTTTFRPPYTPVSFGAMGGHHRGKEFRPTRRTAAHAWAAEQGASFVESGVWLRAEWFTRPGETDWMQSCAREVATVRGAVGICDVSTLGKIDIQGPDAAALLDRLYTGTFSTLPVGRARYGLMLREDGFVFDDGTTARLGAEHYLMTTTTANAGKVMQHIEFALQWLWPELDAQAVSVTEQWAQFAVAGPRSRELLARVVAEDVSNEAVPFMAALPVTLPGGVRGRLFRISFSGELAYEIGAPSSYGEALARALMEAGRDLGVAPYGLEALNVMRIEKGHVAGGELNGQTTARDLGLQKMVSTKKDFIGRVMAQRPALVAPDRPALVGWKSADPSVRVSAGAHFLDVGAAASMENDLGYVTAAAWSAHAGGWIGLGLMKHGPERIGETVRAWDAVRGRDTPVTLCAPCFYDPQGERLRG
ncbi:sarcosine oxidase subunit alpha family protein [Alsobacter sp. SYSU M60028]|uniref:Sarcosine oxidase subunit alpha family protein n=1 Tax=Alsobacter ponti TaxID=2962936 RepID=A0ABT1L9A1_9HYPH|nr:sarcosine oxidase subunit alpha family protein [Alsobacter ponti]MCP8937676.1 sarcosine oxidase subunit alpha family protein [Alsobacter ponti]